MPYLRHFSSFVPKIYDFERRIGVNNMRKLLCYKHFRIGVFFFEKRLIVPKIVPKVVMEIVKSLAVPFEAFPMLYGIVVNSKIGLHKFFGIMRF